MGTLSIDLNKAHLTRRHGDLLVVFSWVNDERSMILIPAYRKGEAWYVICESSAWRYDNKEYLKKQCMVAAEVLGMEPSPNNWFKLASVIHDGLPDLIEMPSAPDNKLLTPSLGEMRMYADGKLMAGEEIRVEREEGANYGV